MRIAATPQQIVNASVRPRMALRHQFCGGFSQINLPPNTIGIRTLSAMQSPKPASKIWERVAPGIYRYLKSQTLYERPSINGRRTCRSLGTTDLQTAKCEFRRRRGLSPEPARARPSVRAIPEFNLPEAQESFEASVKGLEWKTVVMDLDRHLYSWIKERHPFASPARAFRVLRQRLHQRLAEKGLRLV